MIHDDKFNMKCYPNYFQSRLAEAEVLWQLWQYAYLWNEFHSEQGMIPCLKIQKMPMVYEPSVQVECYSVDVTPGRLKLWHDSAMKIWAMMELGITWRNYRSCLKPWKCPMYA